MRSLQEVLLPRVMEQIVQCKDNIAQQYLMQCLIQGFPDDFHVSTLDALLGALPELQAPVKVHVILSSMLDRLARYVHCMRPTNNIDSKRTQQTRSRHETKCMLLFMPFSSQNQCSVCCTKMLHIFGLKVYCQA